MATCNGCHNLCNCYLSEDGFFANRPQDGRRNTVVTGFGTDNPYVLQFQQSEFYRPPSTELRLEPETIPEGVLGGLLTGTTSNVYYESPSASVVLQPWDHPSLTYPGIGIATDEFKIIGASATFPPHSDSDGFYQLILGALNPSGGLQQTVAGQRSAPRADGPTRLSVSAFSPGIFEIDATPLDFTPTHKLNVWFLSIGSIVDTAVTVTDIKFWVTTI